jgi:hypothetical protein
MLTGSLQGDAAIFAQNGFNLSVASTGDSLTGTNDAGQTLRLGKVKRASPSLNQAPPAGAIVLFDGSSASAWTGAVIDSGGYLRAQGFGADQGAVTTRSFRDFQMHLEFYLPFEPSNTGTGRANSGIYLQKRYEIQILDSFGESLLDLADPAPKQHCAAVWEQTAPSVNMTFPPLTWQTYDIDFRAARYNAQGVKTDSARITLLHNGVRVHDNKPFLDRTVAGDFEGPADGPHRIQGYGHPVLFRNIWIVERPDGSPVLPKPKIRQGTANPALKARYAVFAAGALSFLPNGRRIADHRAQSAVDGPVPSE